MAITFDPDASRRLLDALARFREPQGEGVRATERSPVPKEAADAFRELLAEKPEALDQTHAGEAVRTTAGPADPSFLSTKPIEETQRARTAQSGMEPLDRADLATDAPHERLTPEALLRAQFSLNMHVFETQSLSRMRDSGANQADQILKSGG